MKTRLPRKALSLFLSLVMMLSLLPTMAWAEDGETHVAQIGDTKYETLADALKDAESGDTIKILDGTWGAEAIGKLDEAGSYTNANLVRYKSLTIQPAVGATVKFTSDVSLGYDDSSTANATMTVKGLNFSGASLQISNYVQVEVDGCDFTNGTTATNGVLVIQDSCCKNHKTTEDYPVSQVTVKNCTIDGSNTGASGIRLRNSGNVTLANNIIKNSKFNGILFESNGSIDNTAAKTISVTDNTITEWNSTNATEQGRGIRAALGTLADGSIVTITGNYFTKETLGLDKPDFMKITEAGNATVNLNGNDWNDELLSTVSGKSDYYTVNGIAPTLNSVITTKGDPTVTYVAQIGEDKYTSLADAIAAVSKNAETTITVLENISETFATVGATVNEGKKVILDLAGHTVAGTSTASGYTQYIYVENGGYLTINDSSEEKTGKITYLDKYINDLTSGSNTGGAAIRSNGCLTVNAGTIENLTPDTNTNDLEAAIDMYTNAWGKAYEPADIVLNINGGVIKSNNANTVRLTSFSAAQYTTSVTVNMNGGEVYGRDGFFIQGVSEGNLNTNTLNLNGGKVYGTQAVRVMAFQSTANASATKPVKIVVKGTELTNNYNATSTKTGWEKGICIDNLSGTLEQLKSYVDIQTYVAQIGETKYETLQAAIAAVNDGQTIEILCDIPDAVGMTINTGKTFTIDFDNHTYTVGKPGAGSTGTKTQGFQIIKGSNVTFKDGTIQVDPANKDVTWKKDATEKGIAWLINNYGNMTLANMTIDGTNLAHNFASAGGQEAAGTPRYVINNNTNSMTMTGGSITAAAGDVAVSANWYNVSSYPDHPAVTLTNATIAGKVEAIAGTVNLKDGTTVNGMVRVGENGKDGDKATPGTPGAVVTIENGAQVINNNYVAVFGANTLNVYGEVNGCVSTNGNAYNAGSVINIYDGAVVTNNEAGVESGDAIYMPNGTLNVYGGTITGTTAVYFKSTTLNITGGTFIGTGTAVNYQYYGSGGIATGDALVIDSCNYPSGISGVSVSGGSFKSANANAVMSFVSKGADEVKNFISGGLYSSEPNAAYIAAGKVAVENTNAQTKETYPWTIGTKQADVVIKDGEGDAKVTTDVTTTTNYKVTVDANVIADSDVKTNVETKTEVKGVELQKNATVGTDKVTGVQAVINAAKAKATTDNNTSFTNAVAAATTQNTTVTVKVDVEVKPTAFDTANEIKFELKPVATVTIKNGTEAAATQTVPVTNDMIDQEQDIEVSIYTGEMPKQILHKEGDKVIDSFTGNQIVFDEATGVSKVIIHHFSDLVAVMQNSAVVTYVAKNVQTDTQYTTLTQALTEAQSGETVVLLKDVSNEQFVTVFTDVTLDLNGHSITGAYAVFATGTIVDSKTTTATKGYIQAGFYQIEANETPATKDTPAYLPIYDVDVSGYRFFKLAIKQSEKPDNDGYYFFKLGDSNEGSEASSLLRKENNNHGRVKAVIRMKWTENDKTVEKNLTYLDNNFGDVLASETLFFNVRFTGLDGATNVSAVPMFITTYENGTQFAQILRVPFDLTQN